MVRAANKCVWLMRNRKENCGKSCVGAYCKQHNYQLKKRMQAFSSSELVSFDVEAGGRRSGKYCVPLQNVIHSIRILLLELFKIRDSFRPDLATEPLVNVPVTDCNDFSQWRPHLKRENEKATTQLSCLKLLKRLKQGHASFPKRGHWKIKIKLGLFKLRCTQDGLQQPSFYTRAIVQSFPGAMPGYGREPTGRSLPATSTATITNALLHNIMPENASSSVERPVNRYLSTVLYSIRFISDNYQLILRQHSPRTIILIIFSFCSSSNNNNNDNNNWRIDEISLSRRPYKRLLQ